LGGGSQLLGGLVRILKILAGIVMALIVFVAVAFVAARFHDGPLAVIPGGPLASGELVSRPVSDWSFAESVETIELQLVEDDSSRTTWILVRDGRAFIPCSLRFPPGKNWHFRADRDGRAIIRILGKRYPVTLNRLRNSTLEPELKAIVSSKYGGRPPGDSGVWFFSVESRAS
jgi:hypothetical protein